MAMTIELEQVVRFLLGEDDIDGHWFGEAPKGKGNYWWRHQLREAWQAHITQPAQAVDVGKALTAGQRAVATELLRCCESWERGVRVMGNVQAGDAADLLRSLLAASSGDVTATDFATAMRDCGISLHTFAKVDQRARQIAKERTAALPKAEGVGS